MMRCDLHVHSWYSGRADVPVLGHVGRECYSDPGDVYEHARRRGMDLVTLTDHDSIEGALRLAHLPATFVSEEVTVVRSTHFDVEPLAWFPSDRFSFPSGHALNAFAMGSVIALAFPLLAVPVLIVAGSVAASRVVLGLHWLSDVLVGAFVGALIGTSVWLALPP
jgi:membrane-associated phospholipid phosphatase